MILLAAMLAASANYDAAIIAEAKTSIANELLDPQAAQFRGIHVVPGANGGRKVCGEVNGKNSYGGYVGFRGFAYEGAYHTGAIKNPDEITIYETMAKGC